MREAQLKQIEYSSEAHSTIFSVLAVENWYNLAVDFVSFYRMCLDDFFIWNSELLW